MLYIRLNHVIITFFFPIFWFTYTMKEKWLHLQPPILLKLHWEHNLDRDTMQVKLWCTVSVASTSMQIVQKTEEERTLTSNRSILETCLMSYRKRKDNCYCMKRDTSIDNLYWNQNLLVHLNTSLFKLKPV